MFVYSKGEKMFIKRLVLLGMIFALMLGCQKKKNIDTPEESVRYSITDAKNTQLRKAIRSYNNEVYSSCMDVLDVIDSFQLKENDKKIYTELKKQVNVKLENSLVELDSLAVSGKLASYDFKYGVFENEFGVKRYWNKIRTSKEKYLERVENTNNKSLTAFNRVFNTNKERFEYKEDSNKRELVSLNSPLRLRITQIAYEKPSIRLEFYPSQKESEIETVKLESKSNGVFLSKNDKKILDYNQTPNKIIIFPLENNENSQLSFNRFYKMIKDDDLKIKVKWFYEPENVKISAKTKKSMIKLMNVYESLQNKYQDNINSIYNPRYVKKI